MVKLYCLVTIPPSSVSSVELDESCTLDDLKKEIKAKNENVVKCDADKLHLYLAQRDGNWLNHWAVIDLKPCALDLECLKYPQMSLKCAGLGEDRAPLLSEEELIERNGVLHVVVVVPVQTYEIKVYIDEAVDEAIKARDKKRDVYLFDECPSTKVDELKRSLGLSIKLFDINETQDCSVPNFAWKGEAEPKELLSYVKTHLQDVFATPDYFLKDAASNEHLLWMNDTRLEFAVKGITDMVIVDKAAQQFRDPGVGLCFIIEVEKDLCDDFERHETGMLLKLIAADFISEPRRAPVALLTDLNNAWYFFWFTEEKEIAILLLESPANSFQFIKDVLSSGPGTTEEGVYLAKSSIVANDDGLKRQKLSTLEPPLADMAAWETLQRFESISEHLSPEFMRERRLEYFLRSLSQMPKYSYMTLLEQDVGSFLTWMGATPAITQLAWTMVKLFCVLSFDLDSAFSVELDETSTVKDLKTAIKATKPQAISGNLKAGKLQVYLGQYDGKWLTSTTIQNLNIDSLNSERLEPSDKTLERAGLSENATAQPSDEEIAQGGGYVHIVVVVPQGKVTELMYPERAMQLAEELIKEREMHDILTCAECSAQQFEELKKKLGLSTKLLEVEESEDDAVPGFDWSEDICNERNCGVRAKYVAYMNDGLSFRKLQSNTMQQYFLEDTAAKKVLSISGAAWMQFDINDTADLIIVDRLARHYRLPFAGLRFIIEVKRDLLRDTEGYIREVLLKLIVADFKSDKRRAPVGLLTDLNTAWYFFWFTAEQEIVTLLLRYPAHGFQFIKDILSGDSAPSAQGIYMMSCSFLNDQPALKRRKLL